MSAFETAPVLILTTFGISLMFGLHKAREWSTKKHLAIGNLQSVWNTLIEIRASLPDEPGPLDVALARLDYVLQLLGSPHPEAPEEGK